MQHSNWLAVLWAVCYLVDGFLYQLSGFFHDRKHFGLRQHQFWSDLLNTVSSILYLASQAYYFHPDFLSSDLDVFFAAASTQAWLYFVSLFVWALNSFQYVAAWRVARKEPEWGVNPPTFKVWFSIFCVFLADIWQGSLFLCRSLQCDSQCRICCNSIVWVDCDLSLEASGTVAGFFSLFSFKFF